MACGDGGEQQPDSVGGATTGTARAVATELLQQRPRPCGRKQCLAVGIRTACAVGSFTGARGYQRLLSDAKP